MARLSGTGRVMVYLLGGTIVAASTGQNALAEFPGEVWGVSYVNVSGADASTANAVNLGVTQASDVYFYGDKATRIDANVSGGSVDLRMVELGSGQTVAEARGLPISGSNVSGAAQNAALAWMESLNCAEGCQVAVSGAAPQPVRIAETPSPEPVRVAEAPTPEPEQPRAAPAVEAPKPVEPIQKAEPIEAPQPELQLALEQPKPQPPKPAAPVSQAAPASASSGSGPGGLDADAVLAALDKPEPTSPARAATTAPAPAVSQSAPSLVALPAPRAAAPEITAPDVTAPAQVETSQTAAAPIQEDSAPEISLEQPVPEVTTPEAPSIAETAEAPEVAEVAPQVEVNTPEIPAPAAPEVETPEIAAPPAPEPTIVTSPEAVSVPEVPTAAVRDPEPEPEPEPQPELQLALPTPTVEVPAVPAVEAPAAQVPSIAPPVAPELVNPAPSGNSPEAEEQLALADPAVPQVPALPSAETESTGSTEQTTTEDTPQVETRLAAVDPEISGPTLANARWIGFTPAVYTGGDGRPGAWIAGPFDRKQRTGWITDTATGATTRVTFYWREANSGGRTATLSREAARALGIGQGDVANVAVYLPR